MDDLTFEEAIEVVRHKVFRGIEDEEYYHAINTIMVMWDNVRVAELNAAIIPKDRYPLQPDTLYILMKPIEGTCLQIKKARSFDYE